MKIKIPRELKHALKRLYNKWAASLLQLLAAFLLAFASIFFLQSSFGRGLEIAVMRQLYWLRGPVPPPSEVIVVKVDDLTYKTLEASTNYPVPRRLFATALENIVSSGAKAVILDAKIPNERFVDAAADDRIEAALKIGPTTIWTGELPKERDDPTSGLVIPSEERFRKAAKMELPMLIYGEGETIIYIANLAKDAKSLYQRVPIARALVELAGYSIESPGPTDLINYYGTRNTIPSISLSDLIVGDVAAAKDRLKNRVVLIGYHSLVYAKGTMGKDEFFVPVSDKGMFGVEIHATIVANLIDRSWFKRAPIGEEVVSLFIAVFVLASYTMRAPRPKTLLVLSAFVVLIVTSSILSFCFYNFWISGVGTLLVAWLFINILSVIYFFRRTEAYQRYIDRTFNFERERQI